MFCILSGFCFDVSQENPLASIFFGYIIYLGRPKNVCFFSVAFSPPWLRFPLTIPPSWRKTPRDASATTKTWGGRDSGKHRSSLLTEIMLRGNKSAAQTNIKLYLNFESANSANKSNPTRSYFLKVHDPLNIFQFQVSNNICSKNVYSVKHWDIY